MTETRSLDPGEWELWDAWMRAQRLLTRELERGLQRDCDISKPEFSVLVTLWQAAGRELRVGELAESLDWDKSRVSHQLTRMEKRGFVERTRYGADGRRAGIRLTAEGRRAAGNAVLVHGDNIRRHFLDPLTPEQASVIRAWSEQAVDRLEPHRSAAAATDAADPPPTGPGAP
ncbi:MarR family winged helix-turn-helix transcriptional regulator [Kitasatospora saccharophila]|uniref:MarR family winged helix-turn-helix transcriptional regulator n=1 Tax=Kitasatospora saccharophila TaxID=407973 RepID=A0ABN2WFY4_9ACTN